MAAFSALWAWAKDIPSWVYGLLAAFGVYVVVRRDAYQDGQREERIKNERASIKKDREILEQSNEAVEAADTVRANTKRVSATRVRDEQPVPGYHYRD